ncbi:MAG: transferase [Kangiellaceae bacterium]|mgnify:CR=1 FL=1|jgi:sugar O-acyltransferase (sialic acid O-acetyltransferase NeuD family)|nr:transferase [Kangiellaceae bacterium]|tara:strand:- start:4829 stop:5494 length:666 start_codon:yes stop_codon:yes gene_type:complete
MIKKIVIFGAGDIAQLAHYYFTYDSDYEVVAFTVDRNFIKGSDFCGLPVHPFDESLTKKFPSDEFKLFIALSYSQLNQVRKQKYCEAKALGYELASYISSKATILTDNIGDNCFILEDNTLQPFTSIGPNTTLWSGNHIGHHSSIGAHNFIASHVVVSGGVTIGNECFIGVNATLRDHICVGDKCVIGAGVILMADAGAEGLYKASSTKRASVPSSKLKNI